MAVMQHDFAHDNDLARCAHDDDEDDRYAILRHPGWTDGQHIMAVARENINLVVDGKQSIQDAVDTIGFYHTLLSLEATNAIKHRITGALLEAIGPAHTL